MKKNHMDKNKINNNGITLISLILTILIIIILSATAVYTGSTTIQNSKLTAFAGELQIIQRKLNEIYQDESYQNVGETLQPGTDKYNTAKNLFNGLGIAESELNNYKYFNSDTLESELDITGVKQEVLISVEKRDVISLNGLKYDGKMFHTLEQLRDVGNGTFNIEYENPNRSGPDFNVSYQKINNNRWTITISDITYNSGYIEKWSVKYGLSNNGVVTNWKTSNTLTFDVTQSGTYVIQLVHGDEVESVQKTITI